MKNISPHSTLRLAALAMLFIAATWTARAATTMELDPAQISLGDSAQLTVRTSGNGGDAVNPPHVAGLEFQAVGQSSEIQIINGAMTSTSSVVYEVTAQAPGTYTIPAMGAGARPLTLQVLPSGAARSAPVANQNGQNSWSGPSPSLPTPATVAPSAGATHMMANGNAFVRMEVPKRDLYVGETVPVDIQVGLRAGLAATLNGLPTLNADAFTLNKLTTKPEQTEEEINGEPFTILTWHSALAAIKPGDFSLAVETPVTVQIRTRPQGLPMDDDNSPFNSSFFQNFFGTVTKKDLTLNNDPVAVKVQALPTAGQPVDFSGAVGKFTVTSELSATTASTGDPLTLRLKISGAGSFDRVNSSMLGNLTGWKTYHPTVKFTPADAVGYGGEKVFEQAVIPMQSGHLTLPALTFTYFNPDTQKYETATAAPTSIEVTPGSGSTVAANSPASASTATTPPVPAAPATTADGLRADRVDRETGAATLLPLYFQPGFLLSQALLALGFLASWVWWQLRERAANDPRLLQRREQWQQVTACLKQMKDAAAQRDTGTFFLAARAALQHGLALRWNLDPQAVTETEIKARLNGSSENLRRVFELADEIAYSGHQPASADFKAWDKTVRDAVKDLETV